MKQLADIKDRNEQRKVMRSLLDGIPWSRHPKGRLVENSRSVAIAQFGDLDAMKRDEYHAAYAVQLVNDHVEADIDALLAIIDDLSAKMAKPQPAGVRR